MLINSQLAVDFIIVDGDVREAAIRKINKPETACTENGYVFSFFALETRGMLDQADVYLLQRIMQRDNVKRILKR